MRRQLNLATSRWARQYSSRPGYRTFNRNVKRMQRDRAAVSVETSRQVDYLRDEAAFRLCERLLDIDRKFPRVLDLGANSCNIAKALSRPNPDVGSAAPVHDPIGTRITELVALESSRSMLFRDSQQDWTTPFTLTRQVAGPDQDEVELVPFPDESYDAVLSSLSLHWVNDLPGLLADVNRVLKPDCPFLGVMIGGDSLYELRTSLQLASLDRLGGMGVNVSPLADTRDVGGVLQRAGFKLLTVDVDDIVVDYPDMFSLMQDLQAMGEQNCLAGQSGPVSRDVLAAANGIYRALHGNDDGSFPATFRLIFMIGWKDGPDQQRPLARGTGMVSIKDMLESKGFSAVVPLDGNSHDGGNKPKN